MLEIVERLKIIKKYQVFYKESTPISIFEK